MILHNKLYKFISLFIKLVIVVTAFGFIYKKIFHRKDIDSIQQSLQLLISSGTYVYLFPIFLLMFLNWMIEALKWKILIQPMKELSLINSFKAVLSGVTVSIFTPNRIGEFGGRIFFLEASLRIKGILLTMIGSISQLLITIAGGLLALLFYPEYSVIKSQPNQYIYYTVVIFCLILVFLLMALYINTSFLSKAIQEVSWMNRIKKYTDIFSYHSSLKLSGIVLLSGFRYLVFCIQFYLLLQIFDVNIAFSGSMVMIALTFFAISVIPTVAFTELGVRGATALVFIGILSTNHVGIVSASFALWVINIALPALMGIPFVFKWHFFNRKF